MVTLWLLPCYRLFTSWLLPSYYLAAACLLPGYCLIISWLLPCYCVVTSWLLPSYCLFTAGYFLVTTWLLVTSWLQPGYFLVRFAERRNLFFLRVCQHISTGLYRFTNVAQHVFTSCCSVSCSVNPDLHGSRMFITVYTTARTYTEMSFGNRKREVHHRIHNSPHIYENVI